MFALYFGKDLCKMSPEQEFITAMVTTNYYNNSSKEDFTCLHGYYHFMVFHYVWGVTDLRYLEHTNTNQA